MARDRLQLASACQVLLALAGVDDQALWTRQGPSRRASWLKGYIRRGATGPLPPIAALTRSERTMLLAAFDFWNGSGEVLFKDLLDLKPRLALAIAGFMEAHFVEGATQGAAAMDAWIVRWSGREAGGARGPG